MEDTDVNITLKINLILFNGSGSVWNIAEWRKLRQRRIVGSLIGNVAHAPHQIRENGLPCTLTRNETTLLLEKQLAVLWDYAHLLEVPESNLKTVCRKEREASFENQAKILINNRKQEILDRADIIVNGKFAKRMKISPAASFSKEDRQNIIDEEIAKITKPSEEYFLIQMPTEDPWSTEYKAARWEYPTNAAEEAEYETFKALWECGQWVTPDGKFGGNFLAYPGDPMLYHADYIIRLTTFTEKLSPLDIIAMTRLSNTTRKTTVLACYNDKAVKFQSLSWANE